MCKQKGQDVNHARGSFVIISIAMLGDNAPYLIHASMCHTRKYNNSKQRTMISSILLILEASCEVYLFIYYFFFWVSLMYCWNYIAMDEKLDEKVAHWRLLMEYVVLGILISFNAELVGSVVLKKPSHQSYCEWGTWFELRIWAIIC